MKKIRLLFIFLCLVSAIPKAEAIWDIFTVYSRKNNTIKNIILKALDTPTKKWERIRAPLPEEFGSTSTFIPKGLNHKNPDTYIYFDEMEYEKHPKLHTLNEVYIDVTNKDLDKRRSFGKISQDEKTIAYESYNISDRVADRMHEIHLIVDLGGSNFRWYTYGTMYENLNEEQKTFWIQLFRYMEDQIKYVRK